MRRLRAVRDWVLDAADALRHLRDDDTHEHEALTQNEAARIALEMVMVMRQAREDPTLFQPMMQTILEELDCAEQVMDVAMSLTGMVAVLAQDDDMTRFGDFILKHEARGAQ